MDQEQQNGNKTQGTGPEPASTEEGLALAAAAEQDAEKPQKPVVEPETVGQKRGRMITAGLVATIVVSLVALLVAAIFQVTSGWLVTCPTDLPVNDPAPKLWQTMVSESATPFRLGISQALQKVAGFKGAKPETDKAQPAKQE
jgi:hypothetical protein